MAFMDEVDCGSFFDHIDDLIEFPADNEPDLGSGSFNDFPNIWTNSSDALVGPDAIFSGIKSERASDLSAEIHVPYEDIVQLEWLSTFVEDSFSGGGMTMNKENSPVNKESSSHNQFQTSSPVSVLESSSSSSSCSGGKTMPLRPTHRGPQRARSKRPRPATFNPRLAMQHLSPMSSVAENPQLFLAPITSSESETFAVSQRVKKIPKAAAGELKKKKKMKMSVPSDFSETSHNPPSQSVRKCMHCEITKTPQWRAGPMGPKTLCNACGVRYKSGRLFPEYRPAASPTFVPSLHSNSHKKVVEMRNNGSDKPTMSRAAAITKATTPVELIQNGNPAELIQNSNLAELIPNSNPALDYM